MESFGANPKTFDKISPIQAIGQCLQVTNIMTAFMLKIFEVSQHLTHFQVYPVQWITVLILYSAVHICS